MKKKWIIASTVCIAILMMAVMTKVYIHEKWQSNQIHRLNEEIVRIENDLQAADAEITKLKSDVQVLSGEKYEYLADGFNYLAIGNSITLHGKADYGPPAGCGGGHSGGAGLCTGRSGYDNAGHLQSAGQRGQIRPGGFHALYRGSPAGKRQGESHRIERGGDHPAGGTAQAV